VIALIFFNIWGKQFCKSYHLYRSLHDKNSLLAQCVEVSRLHLSQKQHFVHKVETQSSFREKLIREHLGFIKNQECVIRFLTPESDVANRQQAVHF
jgi:Neuraminidase (sialidase)